MDIGSNLNGYEVLDIYRKQPRNNKLVRVRHSCGAERSYQLSIFVRGDIQKCSRCAPRKIEDYPIGSVYNNWKVKDHGFWPGGSPYILAEHTCGQIRKYTFDHFNKQKQSCKKCIARIPFRKTYLECCISDKLNSYKASAKKRGFSFELTREQFASLVQSECQYCDRYPYTRYELRSARRIGEHHRNDEVFLNGIDRENSKLGYSIDNCVPCCKVCNTAKSTMTVKEWKSMVVLWASKV